MQNANKQLVTQTEEILKTRTNQAEIVAKKLEDKLNELVKAGKNTEFENKITGTLSELKLGIKELRTATPTGFIESDKSLLKDLSNEIKDSIQDMRLEVLTASDKSKYMAFYILCMATLN